MSLTRSTHPSTARFLAGAVVALTLSCGEKPRDVAEPGASSPSSTEPVVEPKGDVAIASPAAKGADDRIGEMIQSLATEDSSGDHAVDTLALRGPDVIAPLLGSLRGKPVSRLHMRAATVLAKLGEPALPQVIALTRDGDPVLKLTAVQALFELDESLARQPGTAPAVQEALRAAANDSNLKVQVLARAALQRYAPPPLTPEVPILPQQPQHKE